MNSQTNKPISAPEPQGINKVNQVNQVLVFFTNTTNNRRFSRGLIMYVLTVCIWITSTCNMHQYVYPNVGLCAEQRDLVAKTIGRGFAICSKKEN